MRRWRDQREREKEDVEVMERDGNTTSSINL
jgi:hypothetical protein